MNPIRLVAVCSALAVALLIWLQARTHESLRQEFERRAAEVESLADFETPPIPDEENVAAGLREVAKALKRHDEENPRPDLKYFWDKKYLKPEEIAEQSKLVRDYLDSVAPIIDTLERALDRPRFRTGTNWRKGVDSVIGELLLTIELNRILTAKAHHARTDKELVHACRLMMRMGERCPMPFVIGREVSWILASIGEMLHAAPRFDAAYVRRELDDQMARALPERGPPAIVLKHERALFLLITRDLVAGRSVKLGYGEVEWRQSPSRRPELYRDALRYLDFFEQQLSLCETTPAEANSIAQGIPQEGGSRQGLLFPLAQPDIRRLFQSYAAAVSQQRLARTALAVLEVKQMTGEWPTVLPEPRLVNPLSGKAFAYVVGSDRVRLFDESWLRKLGEDWEWVEEAGWCWSWSK